MYIFTTQLITLLNALDVNDGGSYWTVTEKIHLIETVVETHFNQEAYDAAVRRESLSDKMWQVPVQKGNYKEDIYKEVPTRVKEYTLNLGAFLKAKNFEPVLFRDFIESTIPSKNITIDFNGCQDVVHCNTQYFMQNLELDFHNFSQKLNGPIESNPLKEKLHQILSSFREDERDDAYQKATPAFKALIAEFFPFVNRKQEGADRKTMARLQKTRDDFVRKNPNKRAVPENNVFWNPTHASKLAELEKRYKADVSPEEQPALTDAAKYYLPNP
jgi:hypothetical protein